MALVPAWLIEPGSLKLEGEELGEASAVVQALRKQNIQVTSVREKGKEISKLKGVVSVSVVTGQYDLIAVVLLKEGFGLLEFYTEHMSRVKGIQNVETFVVYKDYNFRVPYIL